MTKPTVQTFSGVVINLAADSVDPNLIRLDDIILGLSRICRYTGQTAEHRSVAEHSLAVYDAACKAKPANYNLHLAALLHDAEEAYIGDVPSGVKALGLPAYHRVSEMITLAIHRRFGIGPLTAREQKLIKKIDVASREGERHNKTVANQDAIIRRFKETVEDLEATLASFNQIRKEQHDKSN